MQIDSIKHKALRQFAQTGKPKGLPGALIGREGVEMDVFTPLKSVRSRRIVANLKKDGADLVFVLNRHP